VFFSRRKEGEGAAVPESVTYHMIKLDYEALKGLFHLKLTDAAREIGLSVTTFKKACRRFNIERWPFRDTQAAAIHAAKTPNRVVMMASPAWSEPSAFCAPFPANASTGPEFHLKIVAPLDAPACIGPGCPFTHGGSSIVVPMPEGRSTTGPGGWEQGGATPLEAGPAGERSCVEAVMEYLAHGCSISEADVESMFSNDE